MQGMEKVDNEFFVDRSKELGKGCYGVVFKGYHLSENRIIAVKFVSRATLNKVPEHQREIKVMSDLSKLYHPNIMGYYGYLKNEQGLYCFLEFCGGGSLRHLISKKISELKVMALLTQMLSGMAYMNSQHKLHRDLKPDNIMLDENGDLKIADFGLARDLQVQMTKGACTPLYAAPQVISLKDYDERCDVWSAGLILYEMLTGKEMFAHVKTKAQLIEEIKKFSDPNKRINYPKELHPYWQKITLMMLTFDVKARPRFADLLVDFKRMSEEMVKDLEVKYGVQNDEFATGVVITKSLSPYQSRPNKDGKQDMVKKLKEERSFNNFNDLRKFLTFIRMKNDFRTKLIRDFTANVYAVLKNVYKYLLMFLASASYLAHIRENLKEIKDKRITMPDGEIQLDSFEVMHQQEVQTLLSEYSVKQENSFLKFKGVLDSQIISKILGNYMGREEEKKIILECDNILKYIEDAKNGKLQPAETYDRLFLKISNKPDVHITDKLLNDCQEADVKTYAQIRIIGHLDEVVVNANFKQDDYLRMKKQDIENKNKAELIEFIRLINSNK